MNHKLSPREAQIIQLIALGRTHKEIGRDLGIAEQTSRNHTKVLYRKLGATSNANAVAIWLTSLYFNGNRIRQKIMKCQAEYLKLNELTQY